MSLRLTDELLALLVVPQFRVPAFFPCRLHGAGVEVGMTLLQFRRQAAGQAGVLVPFDLNLVHQQLHATEIPAGAVFRFRDEAEYPTIEHDAAELGDAVVVLIEADVGVLHVVISG